MSFHDCSAILRAGTLATQKRQTSKKQKGWPHNQNIGLTRQFGGTAVPPHQEREAAAGKPNLDPPPPLQSTRSPRPRPLEVSDPSGHAVRAARRHDLPITRPVRALAGSEGSPPRKSTDRATPSPSPELPSSHAGATSGGQKNDPRDLEPSPPPSPLQPRLANLKHGTAQRLTLPPTRPSLHRRCALRGRLAFDAAVASSAWRSLPQRRPQLACRPLRLRRKSAASLPKGRLLRPRPPGGGGGGRGKPAPPELSSKGTTSLRPEVVTNSSHRCQERNAEHTTIRTTQAHAVHAMKPRMDERG